MASRIQDIWFVLKTTPQLTMTEALFHSKACNYSCEFVPTTASPLYIISFALTRFESTSCNMDINEIN